MQILENLDARRETGHAEVFKSHVISLKRNGGLANDVGSSPYNQLLSASN